MTSNGNFLIAETRMELVGEEVLYITNYRLKNVASNGHDSGAVSSVVGLSTESTFNLTVQQACADRANLESANTETFTANDVYGGRI
jgi:hypothetical protein